MKISLRNCFILYLTTFVLCISFALNKVNGQRTSSVKPFSHSSSIVEGRSLLDLLLGGSSEGNAATSIKGSSSPVLDLAQSLIGKDNGNTNLYVKILKLIFNLFMDVMMDRMDIGMRREDITPSPFLNLLRPKYILKKSPVFGRPIESMLERRQQSKPYFVE